jgi:asparagine synthase (glutamine-hydrolysing)
MKEGLRPVLDETLAEEKLKRDGLFNATFVRRLLDEHWSGRADHRKTLWTLLSFQLWYDRWGR